MGGWGIPESVTVRPIMTWIFTKSVFTLQKTKKTICHTGRCYGCCLCRNKRLWLARSTAPDLACTFFAFVYLSFFVTYSSFPVFFAFLYLSFFLSFLFSFSNLLCFPLSIFLSYLLLFQSSSFFFKYRIPTYT